jgi:hypothetical protein
MRPRHYREAPSTPDVASLLRLCTYPQRAGGTVVAILFIQGFKIQIQGPNLRINSDGYAAKSEIMGGLGERMGGVA